MIDTLHFIFILLIGLCLGSFASLLAYRWPRGLPWANTRSQCPACGHVLGARDLVPVLSWVFSGGACRHCGAAVSVRYPLFEVACGALCLGLYALIGWQWLLAPVLAAVPFALAGAIIFYQRNSR